MAWSTLELITIVVLVILAVGVHQTMRHFGKGYATSNEWAGGVTW